MYIIFYITNKLCINKASILLFTRKWLRRKFHIISLSAQYQYDNYYGIIIYNMCLTIQYFFAFDSVSLILSIRFSWVLRFWTMSNFIYILPLPQMPLTHAIFESKCTFIWCSNIGT